MGVRRRRSWPRGHTGSKIAEFSVMETHFSREFGPYACHTDALRRRWVRFWPHHGAFQSVGEAPDETCPRSLSASPMQSPRPIPQPPERCAELPPRSYLHLRKVAFSPKGINIPQGANTLEAEPLRLFLMPFACRGIAPAQNHSQPALRLDFQGTTPSALNRSRAYASGNYRFSPILPDSNLFR